MACKQGSPPSPIGGAHVGRHRVSEDPADDGHDDVAGSRPFPTGVHWTLHLLAIVGVVALLPFAKPFLLPVVLAVLLALVLAGPVASLHRIGLPEPVGAAIVVAAVLLVVGVVLLALADPASAWLERAPASAADLGRLLERLREAAPLLHAAAVGNVPPPGDEVAAINEKLATEGVSLTRLVVDQATGLALGTASTVILLYFLLSSENWLLVRLIQRVRSRRGRLRGLALGRCVQRDIAHFLITMSLLDVLLGVATAIALWLLGLPNPTLWGALAAVLNFVPYLGPLVLMALLLMAGVATFDSFGMMVAPPLLALLINALLTYLVNPLVVGRRLDLNPVFVFASVMFWGWAWGVAGTLVAVPMLLAGRQVCRYSRSLRPVGAWLERPMPTGKTIQGLVRAEPAHHWWRRRREAVSRPAAAAPPAHDLASSTSMTGAYAVRPAAHAATETAGPDKASDPAVLR